jgi:hypothetical protein
MKRDLQVKSRVKEILKMVQVVAPGNSVELRIPPYAAIQCVPGAVHRRGTPPNVVEMSGQTLIALSKKPDLWDQLCSTGEIAASGTNSNLAELFNKVSKLISNFDEGLIDGE